MKDRRMSPLTDPSEVPENMSEEQAREFWDTHEITEEYLLKAKPFPDELLLPVRPGTDSIHTYLGEEQLQRPESVNIDEFIQTVERLTKIGVESYKEMAEKTAVEAQEQNMKLVQIVNLFERSVNADIASFGSALSAYERNRVEEHTKRRIRQSLRYAAGAIQSRHVPLRLGRVRRPENRRLRQFRQHL